MSLNHQSRLPQTTDSGIDMSNGIDGDSCESLVKRSEEMLGLAGVDGLEPSQAYRQYADHTSDAGFLDEAQQLVTANMVDPGFQGTLENRYHTGPNFVQFKDGRPWLQVKDKDNGKTLRYPIRAPVPVQISTSSTVELPAGPAFTQGGSLADVVVGSAWYPSGEFAPDLPSNFDSFCGTNSTSSSDFAIAGMAQQHGSSFPIFAQPAHHHHHPVDDQHPIGYFKAKIFPAGPEETGASYAADQGAQQQQHHHYGFAAPQDVYKMTPHHHPTPGTMFQGHHTFI